MKPPFELNNQWRRKLFNIFFFWGGGRGKASEAYFNTWGDRQMYIHACMHIHVHVIFDFERVRKIFGKVF